jgi:hypothetical protein
MHYSIYTHYIEKAIVSRGGKRRDACGVSKRPRIEMGGAVRRSRDDRLSTRCKSVLRRTVDESLAGENSPSCATSEQAMSSE